jgi:hypothetical protein
LVFKYFTGLTIEDIDKIYNKEIIKRYEKYEIQRYPKEIIRSELWVQVNLSNWMLKTDS